MKVLELKDFLSKYPDDMEIAFEDEHQGGIGQKFEISNLYRNENIYYHEKLNMLLIYKPDLNLAWNIET